jgi:hypothetical protein
MSASPLSAALEVPVLGFLIFMFVLLLVFGGVIAGIVFLVRASSRAGKKHFDDVSTSLLPLIAGTAQGQKLVGTYAGTSVVASIVVQAGTSDGDGRTNEYYFLTTFAAGPGSADWSLAYEGDGVLHSGQKSWHLKTKDHELETRLAEAGVLGAAAPWTDGAPTITYRAKDGSLTATSPRTYKKTWPAAAAFANHLAVLAALVECNRRANGTVPAAGPAVTAG